MTPRRSLRLVAVLLALPLSLTACAGDAASPAETAAPLVTSLPPVAPGGADVTPTPDPTPTAAQDDAQAITLTVADGKATGDTGRVPVALGEQVRVTVTADVADEIHVHGYDLHQDTTPGTPVTLEFVADRPGVFEVELEESRVLLTRLQVQ